MNAAGALHAVEMMRGICPPIRLARRRMNASIKAILARISDVNFSDRR